MVVGQVKEGIFAHWTKSVYGELMSRLADCCLIPAA